jgi:hypothetical protein
MRAHDRNATFGMRKYTADDADVHTIHADSATKKKVWADIANQAIEDGKSDEEAVAEANAYVAKMRAADKVVLNRRGEVNARSLISVGAIDKDSAWRFTVTDSDELLGEDGDDWITYSTWFLGEDTSAKEKTKQRYEYPFGKNGKIYKSALDDIRSRAAAEGATKIFESAGDLLDLINDSDGDPDRSVRRLPRGTIETRLADIKSSSYDAETRTVEAVLSAGAPVKRPYGTEILEISAAAIDLKRLASCGVPLIDSHNIFGIAGVLGQVKRAWISGGELLGLISFDDSDVGREAEGLVARGMVRGVSIGYRVERWEVTDDDGTVVDPDRERLVWDEDYTFTAKRWELMETSLVSVPADPAAAVRSAGMRPLPKEAAATLARMWARQLACEEYLVLNEAVDAAAEVGNAAAVQDLLRACDERKAAMQISSQGSEPTGFDDVPTLPRWRWRYGV